LYACAGNNFQQQQYIKLNVILASDRRSDITRQQLLASVRYTFVQLTLFQIMGCKVLTLQRRIEYEIQKNIICFTIADKRKLCY